MSKWILSIIVFLISILITGYFGFFVIIFLVGPHSDILPDVVHIPAGVFLLTLIIGIPVLIGWKTFNYLKLKEQKNIQNNKFGNEE